MRNRAAELSRLPLGFALALAGMALVPPLSAAAGAGGQQEEEQQEQQEAEGEEIAAVSERLNFSEQVVVSASRVEQEIVNAPAAITVLGPEQIETQASGDFGDLVRQAPGVNVVQLSNRDVNVNSRGASGTLATAQLVLVDGRSVYQDFFGFVAWDMISVGMDDLERVEVVNGPASAIWGANAMSGVVNLITRAPRDNPGTTLDLRMGTFERNVPGRDMDPGSTMSGTLNHSQVVSDTLAYRLSVGFSQSDAFARPAGEVPNGTGTMYPPIDGLDAGGPKVDLRVDWDAPDRSSGVRLSGGYASTQGMLHTGLGPFQVQSGSAMSYGRIQYLRGSMEVGAFVNSTNSEFNTLLVTDPAGNLVDSHLRSNTFDLSLKDSRFLGSSHLLSYGAGVRAVTMDFGLASSDAGRNEFGAYLSDEIFLTDRLRWIVGARADRISTMSNVQISPRTTLIFKPTPTQAFRVSYNQAFRAPSLTNSYLHTDVGSAALFDLRPAFRSFFPGLNIPDAVLPDPVLYRVPFTALGNLDLMPETLTAWEAGWSGAINEWAGATLAVYRNRTDNVIDFTDHTFWSGADPPGGWNEAFAPTAAFVRDLGALLPPGTLPPSVAAVGQNPAYLIDLLGPLAGVALPKTFTYVNRDFITNIGVETGLNFRRGDFGGYVNYSWQAEPEFGGFTGDDALETNLPPAHRVNAGVDGDFGRLRLGATVNHSTRAFWADVLTADYHGWTEPYTMLNASATLHLFDGRLQPRVRVLNLLNQDIQQHIFADVIKRQVIGQIRYRF